MLIDGQSKQICSIIVTMVVDMVALLMHCPQLENSLYCSGMYVLLFFHCHL